MSNKEHVEFCLRGLREMLGTSYNIVWDAYSYHKSWWLQREHVNKAFRDCWSESTDKIYENMDKMKKAIATHINVEQLHQIGEELCNIASTFSKAADEFYSNEDCWNPRLPQYLTKVKGHEFTCTEFIRMKTSLVASNLAYYGGVLIQRVQA